VAAYFEHFHPSLPLVHWATFHTASAPRSLVSIQIAIGILYTTGSCGEDIAVSREKQSKELWANGVKELQSLVSTLASFLRNTVATFLRLLIVLTSGRHPLTGESFGKCG
jgi:hypothetical protein